jgi:Cu(I)/Ag(I) efflux system membrane fusion protein
VSNKDYFLKPNMFADIRISSGSNQPILVVPSESVIRTGKQNRVVLALGDGAFKSVEVSIGQIFERDIEVLSGLMEGDLVVSSAQFLLDSESSVSSDFMRVDKNPSANFGVDSARSNDGGMNEMESMGEMNSMSMSEPTWVMATIDDVMPDERILRLTHEDIDDWGMPAMTMNFVVLDSVEFNQLQIGATIEVMLQKPDTGMFEIMDVKL